MVSQCYVMTCDLCNAKSEEIQGNYVNGKFRKLGWRTMRDGPGMLDVCPDCRANKLKEFNVQFQSPSSQLDVG